MRCARCGKPVAELNVRQTEGEVLCPHCARRLEEEKCPECGTTVEEFRRTGLLGCAHCYTVFRQALTPTIRYVQGNLRHEGKVPSREAEEKYFVMRELVSRQESLKGEIEEAMRTGRYSDAERLQEELLSVNRRLYGGELS